MDFRRASREKATDAQKTVEVLLKRSVMSHQAGTGSPERPRVSLAKTFGDFDKGFQCPVQDGRLCNDYGCFLEKLGCFDLIINEMDILYGFSARLNKHLVLFFCVKKQFFSERYGDMERDRGFYLGFDGLGFHREFALRPVVAVESNLTPYVGVLVGYELIVPL